MKVEGLQLLSGHTLQRKDRWVSRVTHPDNPDKQIWLGTYDSIARAETEVRDADYRARRGEPIKQRKALEATGPTLREFSEVWIGSKAGRHAKTQEDCRLSMNRILPVLGDVPVAVITRRDLNRLTTELERQYARSTVRKTLTALQGVMNLAYEEQHLVVRPDPIRKPPRLESSVREFTDAEIRAIMSAADDFHQLLFRTALMLGLRAGELFGLSYEDIDWDAGQVRVHQQMTPEGVLVEGLKWGKKQRILELSKGHAELLRNHVRLANEHNLVFTTMTGRAIRASNFTRDVIGPLRRTTGIKDLTLHVFRSTYATRLVHTKHDLNDLHCLMGHKDITTTLKYYNAGKASGRKGHSESLEQSLFGTGSSSTLVASRNEQSNKAGQ